MSGQVVGGRYRLQQQLGRGGTASVWRAQDTRLDRSAAVKLLDPAWRSDPMALERLRREAHSVARLAHRNIVGVYDFDVADDAAYLVMELVEGRSVTELLAVQGRLPVEQAVSIAAQICDALGAAHAAGVVHRDIKPSNVLVSPAGVVKVCDFGIARLQRAAGQAALTSPGAVVGTIHYMAPEQAAGESVDGRSDLYAVGCLLYMMLVGGPPFHGTNPIDVLDQHLNEPPVPLRAHRNDVPPALHQLVDELLAKDRADRPATAWSVRDRLTAIGGRSTASPSDPNPPTAPLPAAEDWPTRHTSPSLDLTVSRHRATFGAVPAVEWLRRRVSPWVAALVAVAVVTTVMAAVALARGGGEPNAAIGATPSSAAAAPDPEATQAEPTASSEPSRPTPTTSTAAAARATPIQQISGLAAILQQQANTGRLPRKTAKSLLRDLNEVARLLNAGKTSAAATKFAQFRHRVAELRKDGKLTGALPDLGRIAASFDAG